MESAEALGQVGDEASSRSNRAGRIRRKKRKYPLEAELSALRLRAADAEFGHPALQRGAVEAEEFCGAAFALDPPAGLLEDAEKVSPLNVFHGDGLGGSEPVSTGDLDGQLWAVG